MDARWRIEGLAANARALLKANAPRGRSGALGMRAGAASLARVMVAQGTSATVDDALASLRAQYRDGDGDQISALCLAYARVVEGV